jgi:Lamin Tail Domain
MKRATLFSIVSSMAVLAAAVSSHAAIRVTEIAPWSSGNSPFAADWFEVTNTGTAAMSVTGWSVDDNSNSFGSSRALNGISSIAAGESVIFFEGASTSIAAFRSHWFGTAAPASLQIGYYSGAAIGLSTGGDAVNLFSPDGSLQANVSFGVSDSTAPFQTFDNSQALNGTTVSLLSQVGVNQAFTAFAGGEIGSPGVTPEPVSLTTLAAAGLLVSRRRRA